MARLLYGNFDFEHQLADPDRPAASSVLHRINAELACAWFAIAEPGDAVWTPLPLDEQFLHDLTAEGLPQVLTWRAGEPLHAAWELCPWGWSGNVQDWSRKTFPHTAAPTLDAVRTANCRFFSLALEHEWDVGLDGSTVVQSVDDLQAALRRTPKLDRGWVLKARFGMSARERLLGRGTTVPVSVANWLKPRLVRDGGAVFEPWVEKISEAGIQIDIPEKGSPALIGMTPLLTDASGAYRGNRMATVPGEAGGWDVAVAYGLRAADRLQRVGYRGPLGIDAMRYRGESGEVRLRAVQDINARCTMGRLALGWRRLLRPGEQATWLHFTNPAEALAPDLAQSWHRQVAAHLPAGARVLRTSPARVGGQPSRHGSALLVLPAEHDLEDAERRCVSFLQGMALR